jgi:hypothetical protein
MRFVAPRRDQVLQGAIECSYLAGMEGIPWRSRATWIAGGDETTGAGEFVVERAVGESGNFYIPWKVAGHGELILSTASLMERRQAYNLPLELARGVVNRLRNQAAEWEMGGLTVPDSLHDQIRAATRNFSRVVNSESDLAACDSAQEAIKAALDTSELLADEFCDQVLAARHDQGGPLPSLLGGRLPCRLLSEAESKLLPDAWNAASIPFAWREIERSSGQFKWDECDEQIAWCQSQGWRIIGGPLLCVGKQNLPDWIYLWEEDFEQLQAHALEFLRATVERYRGKVHIWQCAERMNVEGALSLTEEQRLRLVVAAIDELRRVDPQTPILVSFDQPCGEYLADSSLELSPLHFADSLVRADLGIAGIGLEFNVGYWPHGTFQRDRIEFSRQLDRWSLLGLPLVIYLSAPSSSSREPASRVAARVPADALNAPSLESQQRQVQHLAPLLLAKHYVQGLFWNEFSDVDVCDFANGGLFDATGREKPILDVLTSLRKQYLL